jgi:hypothetical protein
MRHAFILVATVASLTLAPATARSELITYEFSGIVSGTLGQGDLVDAPFVFTLTADASGITPVGSLVLVTENVTLDFSIGGLSGSFIDPFHVFRLALGPNSSVGLSPASGDDLVSITDPSFLNYDLASAIGPITQAPPDFINVGEAYATTLGDLTFIDAPDTSVTFRAFLATPAVPEPSGLVLACVAAASAVASGRRRRPSPCD